MKRFAYSVILAGAIAIPMACNNTADESDSATTSNAYDLDSGASDTRGLLVTLKVPNMT